MQDAATVERIRVKYVALVPVMDERMRRQWAATEAMALGWGGMSAVSMATGLARNTIASGVRELIQRREPVNLAISSRLRRPGAGRKRITETDPLLLHALEELVDPVTRGHPESPLRWTCKSTAKLAEELTRQNHPVSDRTVATLLMRAGYSLQANRKTREGDAPGPQRPVRVHQPAGAGIQKQSQPVISVDTKKKELVGEFKNPGQEWQPKGEPQKVHVHDFKDENLGKAIPYGVYDVANNEGWVSVGIDHDTAYFAAASIRRWWKEMGRSGFLGPAN